MTVVGLTVAAVSFLAGYVARGAMWKLGLRTVQQRHEKLRDAVRSYGCDGAAEHHQAALDALDEVRYESWASLPAKARRP